MKRKLLYSGVTFIKIGALKATLYLRISILLFHVFCPIRVQFRIWDLHIMLLSILEFRKCRCRKVLLYTRWDIKLQWRLYPANVLHFLSKDLFVKICLLHHCAQVCEKSKVCRLVLSPLAQSSCNIPEHLVLLFCTSDVPSYFPKYFKLGHECCFLFLWQFITQKPSQYLKKYIMSYWHLL
jgi:hypothetical protein